MGSGTDLKALKCVQAKQQRLTGGQVVDSRYITVLDESAKLAFDSIHLIESGYCRLQGVAVILMHNKDLEGGRHGLVRETLHRGQ